MVRPANGTEGDLWQAAWCATCRKDVNEDCPIFLTGLMGDHPPEWHRGPNWSPQTTMYCTEYRPR
jgi:hypothetical protein